MRNKKHIIAIATIMMMATAVALPAVADNFDGADVGGETFRVATLNVDGMPSTILFFDANTNGPGTKYTPLLSEYLAKMNVDFIGVQEDFNYDEELDTYLTDDYDHDEWSGGILTTTGQMGWGNLKFPCDGLKAYWKKGMTLGSYNRVAWKESYGKFDHAWDDFVTKGFRHYQFRLPGGHEVEVYNMHMDATDMEASYSDEPDRAVRLSQWRELRNYILDRMADRPIVVLGDFNTFYARDDVKRAFIDSIQSTRRATVGDVWIELDCDGFYPELREDDEGWWGAPGEKLDKVLYINPVGAPRLVPTGVTIHYDCGKLPDGSSFGDHHPVSATFRIEEAVPGDLNGDGTTDVGDIMAIINYMARLSAEAPVPDGSPEGIPATPSPYDLNGDGAIDVGDVMVIINLMTGRDE